MLESRHRPARVSAAFRLKLDAKGSICCRPAPTYCSPGVNCRKLFQVNSDAEIRFTTYGRIVERFLPVRYGVAVVTRDIPDPLTGDLDGLEIHVDCAVTPEQRLFLLAHLLGHTVQWNVAPETFEIGRQYRPPIAQDRFPEILAYEREAASYGLAMLHEAAIVDLDEWFSAYSACDQAYLLHYYRSAEKREFRSFWPDKVLLIQPKTIPTFKPTRRSFRMDGIVI